MQIVDNCVHYVSYLTKSVGLAYTAKIVSLARAIAEIPNTTEITCGVMAEYKEDLRDVCPKSLVLS